MLQQLLQILDRLTRNKLIFSIIVDTVHLVIQYLTNDILRYIAHGILLTCENVGNIPYCRVGIDKKS